jgi:hypothetical protein
MDSVTIAGLLPCAIPFGVLRVPFAPDTFDVCGIDAPASTDLHRFNLASPHPRIDARLAYAQAPLSFSDAGPGHDFFEIWHAANSLKIGLVKTYQVVLTLQA